MPSIVGKLGQINLYSWVISAYLLTSTVTVPIYGKLADIYGRKPLVLFGIGLFVLGSLACSASQSMVQLILFRAIQGIGAGAVLPIVMTIIGDIFSFEERARVQGLFSGVWGVSSMIGPALGGVIVDSLSWHWVFLINLPIGLISMATLLFAFQEQIERKEHRPRLDYGGTITLSISIIALLFACSQGGTSWAWLWLPSLGLFAAFVVFLLLFLFLPMMTVYAWYFNKKMNKALRSSKDRIGDINAQVEDTLAGIRVVKFFTNEEVEKRKFASANRCSSRGKASVASELGRSSTQME